MCGYINYTTYLEEYFLQVHGSVLQHWAWRGFYERFGASIKKLKMIIMF